MKMPIAQLIRTILAAGLTFGAAWCHAQGTVTQISGTLSAQKPDGAIRVLGRESKIETGDTLATSKDSYALVKFTDGSTLTMKPDTQLKIEGYSFEEKTPEKDSMIYSLVKGGLRALTGLIGKRGNQDAYRLNTTTATIGIRGTQFDVFFVPLGDPSTGAGLYLAVIDGTVVAFNQAGFQNFQAGQFGHVPNITTPPKVLPALPPGIKLNLPSALTGQGGGACVVK